MNKSINRFLFYNLKLIPKVNILACVLIVPLSSFLFSFKMLNFQEMADIGELIISLCGLVLLPSLCFPEKNKGTKETVYAKKMPLVWPELTRLVMGILLVFLSIVLFVYLAYLQGSSFSFYKIILGVFTTALSLGIIGYSVGIFTENLSLSYLLPFSWYMLELFTRGKYTKEVYLFSLRTGDLIEGKYILLLFSILLLCIDFLYLRYWKRL
ncbi:hypothetical protein [Bacillus sp. 03113]|uniref:hypothetical protein n=1 Tax=Bacillus sp. 03113 TaxID=2578211 RepID=UPI001142BD34|nr:hypothetical protein [Bacillus sp. 03113]